MLDVRGNRGGHTSQLVVEKLAWRSAGTCRGTGRRPPTRSRHPADRSRRWPIERLRDRTGDIVTAAIKRLGISRSSASAPGRRHRHRRAVRARRRHFRSPSPGTRPGSIDLGWRMRTTRRPDVEVVVTAGSNSRPGPKVAGPGRRAGTGALAERPGPAAGSSRPAVDGVPATRPAGPWLSGGPGVPGRESSGDRRFTPREKVTA
ncbi:hypothetical protein HBB16_02955 [Pseudonocardia sp. MCCB 268]|nr:hypothetical protein [Pseudonocardia cytotoxica]